MSWKAERHSKRKIRIEEPGVPGRSSRGPLTGHRIDDQKVISRLLDGAVLKSIFGLTSVERALRVAIRIKRLKQRTPDAPPVMHSSFYFRCRHGFGGRNKHHLTPRSRRDQPYSGDTPRNLLLIRVDRHDALHRECELRTWEEIIFLLLRCVQRMRGISLQKIIEHISPSSRRNKKRQRPTVRYHCHSRSFSPG